MPSDAQSRTETALHDYVRHVCDVGVRAGLHRVGVAPAHRFDRARQAIDDRNARGLSDTMQFTFRNPARSTDPSAVVRGARSIIVGAVGYHEPEPEPDRVGDSRSPIARVARYAWRDNYAALRSALGVVAHELKSVGHRAVVVADENALVDREAAYLAGLGWYGKNANLLLVEAGSWFVLGGVVTDAVLPTSTPAADGCGTCRRCLDGCPTGAIIEPGVIDAARCLAWVIQKPGIIDRGLREAIGDRIYGCDDCQEVCPPSTRSVRVSLSRRGDESHLVATADHAAMTTADPVAILSMTDGEIMSRFGRWYIHDREARWVRRNALIVLGNRARPDDAAAQNAIVQGLADDDPFVRAHAVWAAARVGHVDLLPDDDPSETVREELRHLPAPRG
ncbi:MAG: tRNA epoxyqueuosine(34) reductase QueG [Ilumatobacteraceae bacterium]|nr:tRNA epoxyqueuosine(34) reductase QueG [Ilumatobacteraceae bacterium]